MSRADYVVVGAGIPGLLAAERLSRRNPDCKVVVVEASVQIGGLYKSVYLSDLDLSVDLGMHVYYETGVKDFDNAIRSTLPESKWSDLSGVKKDVAGIFWRGELHADNPYPDLRDTPFLHRALIVIRLSLVAFLEMMRTQSNRDAESFAIAHFGRKLYEEVYKPILQKLYSSDPASLDSLALKTPELRRVAIVGKRAALFFSRFELMRKRIAFPYQLDLPIVRDAQRGYYPVEIGFGAHVVEPLRKRLESRGVEFLLGHRIESLTVNDEFADLTLAKRSGGETALRSNKVLWCAPVPALVKAARVPAADLSPAQRRTTKYFVVALITGTNPLGGLYYTYIYDPGFQIFRLTNYLAYTSAPSLGDSSFILGIEIALAPQSSDAQVKERVARELHRMQIFDKSSDFSKLWILPETGPPLEPTIFISNWVENASDVARSLLGTQRFAIAGPFTKRGLFFLQDVLRDLDKTIEEWTS